MDQETLEISDLLNVIDARFNNEHRFSTDERFSLAEQARIQCVVRKLILELQQNYHQYGLTTEYTTHAIQLLTGVSLMSRLSPKAAWFNFLRKILISIINNSGWRLEAIALISNTVRCLILNEQNVPQPLCATNIEENVCEHCFYHNQVR